MNQNRRERLKYKFAKSKEYKERFGSGHTRRALAAHLRNLRGEMTQQKFAEKLRMRQTMISRMEDPNYGKMTVKTLLNIADKLGLMLVIQLVDEETYIDLTTKHLAKIK
jgi:transcriptional regulator with XRE-family HTH domain